MRGDELVRDAGVPAGPRLGAILAQLEEDRYAGAVSTRDEALARARELTPMQIEFGGADAIDELVEIVNAAYRRRRGRASGSRAGRARTTRGSSGSSPTGEIAVARDGRQPPIGCVRVRG